MLNEEKNEGRRPGRSHQKGKQEKGEKGGFEKSNNRIKGRPVEGSVI